MYLPVKWAARPRVESDAAQWLAAGFPGAATQLSGQSRSRHWADAERADVAAVACRWSGRRPDVSVQTAGRVFATPRGRDSWERIDEQVERSVVLFVALKFGSLGLLSIL